MPRPRLDESQGKAEAVHVWARRHQVAANAECPTCSGVKWKFRLEPAGPYVPRVCMSCGHAQWFDAVLLGVAPTPTPVEKGRAAKGGPPGKDG